MKNLIYSLAPARRTVSASVAAAVIVLGGAAVGSGPVSAAPQEQQCPATGLVYVCGEYANESDCERALNARGGYIDGSKAWCDEPGSTSPSWRLIASISG